MTSKEIREAAEKLAEIPDAAPDFRAVVEFVLDRLKPGDGTVSRSEINALHNEAMDLYDRYCGGGLEDRSLIREAFAKECRAADAILAMDAPEPSRTVLLKSAAWLAYDCDELRDAERYLCAALSGNPPGGLLKELRILLDQVLNDSRMRPSWDARQSTPAMEGKPCQ